MKIALIHDWLLAKRGGEKVLSNISNIFPDASIYTLIYKEKDTFLEFKNKKICELSAGQLQLCFLGKLLFQDPAIFLLDEPFNNLDENYTTLIIDIIKKLKDKGKIIIIATHRHSYYQINFDMRYEFSNGKLALVDDSNI